MENPITTVEANVALMFEDAHRLADAALERMAAGEVRDAAEEMWYATLRATEALVLARTGQEPGTSDETSLKLQRLSVVDPALWNLRKHYCSRLGLLRDECLSDGFWLPETIDSLVRETADYLRDAERLAQSPPDA